MDQVPISHKTLLWLGHLAAISPHELISKFRLSGLSCCVEPGAAGGQIQKCFDTGTGQCVMTWVSPEGIYPGVPACVGGKPPGCDGGPAPTPAPSPVTPPPPTITPPSVPTPPTPPPVTVVPVIDWTTPRAPRPPGVWLIGPFGPFLAPAEPAPPAPPPRARPTPPSVPGPAIGVPIGQVTRLLGVCEAALESAERAIERGTRCRATDGEREAARAARVCLADLAASVDAVNEVMDELCAASKSGREAMLTQRQVAALEAFVACAGAVAGAEESQNWLTALIGAGLPAAGSVALAVL